MHFTIFVGLLALIRPVFTQNITASTCVDPSGFTSCYQTTLSPYNDCVAAAGSSLDKLVACACVQQFDELACAMSHCWNVVYGCEYQKVANAVNAYCSSDAVPFFPAPDNAPGACSCNLGYVLYNMTAVVERYPDCESSTGLNITEGSACSCCWQSGTYTSKYEICPDTDPSLVGYVADLDLLTVADPPFDQCGSYFNQYNCVQDLGYPKIGSISYLTASPATTGTKTLSTLAGSITSPISGATFEWTVLSGLVSTITAASVPKASGGSGSTTASRKTTGTAASGTGTGTVASSSSTSQSGAHHAVRPEFPAVIAALILAAVMHS